MDSNIFSTAKGVKGSSVRVGKPMGYAKDEIKSPEIKMTHINNIAKARMPKLMRRK